MTENKKHALPSFGVEILIHASVGSANMSKLVRLFV